jgi:hypothetical protein
MRGIGYSRRMKLQLTRYFEPKVPSELTAIQIQQLEAAGKLYFGTDEPASVRMAEEGAGDKSFYGCLEVREISDENGQPAYTSFFYMGDSGTVFVAGTTEVVAQIMQFGLECEVPGLHKPLSLVLDEKPPKK